jgi:hypothetical protein
MLEWHVSYNKKQQLPAFREHLSSPPVFLLLFCCGIRVAHLFILFVLSYYVSSE